MVRVGQPSHVDARELEDGRELLEGRGILHVQFIDVDETFGGKVGYLRFRQVPG